MEIVKLIFAGLTGAATAIWIAKAWQVASGRFWTPRATVRRRMLGLKAANRRRG